MRINLLRKSEIRSTGVITKKMILIIPILTLVLAILIFVPIHFMKRSIIQAKRKALTEQLQQLQAVVARADQLEKICSHNQSIIDALELRAAHALPVYQLLNQIRLTVPSEIQLTTFSYTANPKLLIDQHSALDTVQWPIFMEINGNVLSSTPESVVIPFATRVAHSAFVTRWFDMVQLINFEQRPTTNRLETGTFHISGNGKLHNTTHDIHEG